MCWTDTSHKVSFEFSVAHLCPALSLPKREVTCSETYVSVFLQDSASKLPQRESGQVAPDENSGLQSGPNVSVVLWVGGSRLPVIPTVRSLSHLDRSQGPVIDRVTLKGWSAENGCSDHVKDLTSDEIFEERVVG